MAPRVLAEARRPIAVAIFAAVVYLALHVPFLAWAPDDIDATNFMLALRHFDLREHQPHPPGYPVFIAMAHVARAAIEAAGSVATVPPADTLDVYALALCSALFGALTIFPLVAMWRTVDGNGGCALFAALLTMSAPLFWYTGVRPLSDLPGLAAAVASLALLTPVILERETMSPARRVFAGVVVAGLAAGIRAQTLWLTAPAIVLTAAVMLWRRDLRVLAFATAGLALGVTVWAVPFLVVAGGWRTYLELLSAQAADDFRGAILAANFSVRELAFALRDTFVLPWGRPVLAVPVLSLAIAGGLRLLRERPRAAALIAIVFGPYLVLHLLFHSTSETRYAIPLLLPVAFLASCGLMPCTRWRMAVGAALVAVAVTTSMGPIMAQARFGSPVARVWADVSDALRHTTNRPVIGMHHAVQRQLRFARFEEPPLQAPARYEWLAVVDHFRSGGESPVWFLASVRRSDLALFDSAARRTVHEYRWTFASQAVLGAVRPRGVVWYEINRPGWMAGEGWALTPETRGVAERSRRSPGTGGAVAYIARRPEPVVLMIGGRNLGGPCQTPARLEALLEGRQIGEWHIPAGQPFAYFVDLPAGALGGEGYAELRLRASDLSGAGAGVDVALEQFDAQSGRRPVVALGQGWHEPELEPDTGQRWRWTRQRAVMTVRNFGRDVVLAIKADDPTRTLGRAVTVQVRAAGRLIATHRFDHDIDWHVPIASDVIGRSQGGVTLITEAAVTPDQTRGKGDKRELALRVFDLDVEFDDVLTAGGSR